MLNNLKVSLIVAISENYVFARNNKIPWNIPTDKKRFMDKIQNHIVIMGRVTYETGKSIYDGLRRNGQKASVVITRNTSYQNGSVLVAYSFEEAIVKAKELEDQEIMVIGGQEIFEKAMPIANKLYLTIVHEQTEGDRFFPNYSEFKTEVFRQDVEENGYKYTFLDLLR